MSYGKILLNIKDPEIWDTCLHQEEMKVFNQFTQYSYSVFCRDCSKFIRYDGLRKKIPKEDLGIIETRNNLYLDETYQSRRLNI